jgi:hypothetical protein
MRFGQRCEKTYRVGLENISVSERLDPVTATRLLIENGASLVAWNDGTLLHETSYMGTC